MCLQRATKEEVVYLGTLGMAGRQSVHLPKSYPYYSTKCFNKEIDRSVGSFEQSRGIRASSDHIIEPHLQEVAEYYGQIRLWHWHPRRVRDA